MDECNYCNSLNVTPPIESTCGRFQIECFDCGKYTDIKSPQPKMLWSCIQCRDSIELKDDFSLDFIKDNLDALDEFVTKHSQHRLHFTIPKDRQANDYKENIEIMMGALRERDRRKGNV